MRIAALYDVHGNRHALEAVLEQVERAAPDWIVVGGDVSAGPFPREALELLLALGDRARFLRGNADRALFEGPATPRGGSAALAIRDQWSAARLSAEQLDTLARWPLTLPIDVDGLGPALFVHATPRSDEEIVTRITPDPVLREVLAGVAQRVVVCGHTHVQFDRTVGERRLINAGSVGMAYEGEPGVACWALLGPEVELRRAPYDYREAAEAMRASGYPDAEEFVQKYVLGPPRAADATEFFEKLARAQR